MREGDVGLGPRPDPRLVRLGGHRNHHLAHGSPREQDDLCLLGNLTSVTDPAGRVTSYAYDSSNSNADLQHDLLTVTGPNGQSGGPDAGDKLTNVYTSGQVTSQTDPMGLTTSFNYAAMTGSTLTGSVVVTDPHGNETAYYYSQGALYQTVAGYGSAVPATTSYDVDPSSLLDDGVTDPNGNTTSYTYDSDGNVLTRELVPTSQTTTTTYNSFDEPTSVTDPMGIATSYSYDSSGNRTQKVVTADSTCTSSCTQTTNYTLCESSTCTVGSNTYSKGEPESVTDPWTNTTTYTYDSAGDLATSRIHSATRPNMPTTPTAASTARCHPMRCPGAMASPVRPASRPPCRTRRATPTTPTTR